MTAGTAGAHRNCRVRGGPPAPRSRSRDRRTNGAHRLLGLVALLGIGAGCALALVAGRSAGRRTPEPPRARPAGRPLPDDALDHLTTSW
ncbi:hypothetical protein [Streptomyces sp. NPDC058861]|uniref:hypothetical protein n=1 Tax=Streptomyces sp. NPDC058861 TaxID=3346653 RepID=UPI0036D01F58